MTRTAMDDGYLLAVGANLVFAHVQRVETFPVWNEGEHKVRPYGVTVFP